MQSAGIVTIFGLDNYGNRLQNYAVERVIQELGIKPETIIPLNKKGILAEWYYSFVSDKKSVYRYYLFLRFAFRYTHLKYIYSLTKPYDCYILGSDQIWNPEYAGNSFYFAEFADKRKRIAYSASFGVSEIYNDVKDYYKKQLLEIDHLSVREDAGKELIKKLTGRDAEVLLDPTMMLSKDEWTRLSKKPRFKNPDKYILVYILGRVDDGIITRIDNFSRQNDIAVLYLHEKTDLWNRVGPSEFIWLIQHCSCMITDSFHGCVFSVLLDVPFVALERIGKTVNPLNSRLDTLLNTLNLKNRRTDIIDENIFHKDYSHVSEILEEERNKTMRFLKEAIR